MEHYIISSKNKIIRADLILGNSALQQPFLTILFLLFNFRHLQELPRCLRISNLDNLAFVEIWIMRSKFQSCKIIAQSNTPDIN